MTALARRIGEPAGVVEGTAGQQPRAVHSVFEGANAREDPPPEGQSRLVPKIGQNQTNPAGRSSIERARPADPANACGCSEIE